MAKSPLSSRSTRAWILYDLANTIFALGVVGLYFPSYMVLRDLPDGYLSLVVALVGGVVIFVSPWVGRRSDARGKRIPILRVSTLVAVAATAGLAAFHPLASFILLGCALIGFHVGSVVYDAMLPDVSTPETQGRVSGVGIGVSYIGSFIGLGIGTLALEVMGWSYNVTFRLLAAAFLLFALPAFFFVVEPSRPSRPAPRFRTVMVGLARSWQRARGFPGVVRFLVGRFLYTDAINTLIGGFLAIYVIAELGFSRAQMTGLLGVAIPAAMLGGFGAGFFVDRWGPQRVLRRVLVLWMTGLAVTVYAGLSGTLWLAWLLGPVGGLALGGTWASDRVLMNRLAPPRHRGEMYGLYATVARFATVVGPLLWGLIVNVLGWSRHAAMTTLILFVTAGWWVLRGVDDHPRSWPPELELVSESQDVPRI